MCGSIPGVFRFARGLSEYLYFVVSVSEAFM